MGLYVYLGRAMRFFVKDGKAL